MNKLMIFTTLILSIIGVNQVFALGCSNDYPKGCLADHIEEAIEAIKAGDNETAIFELEEADSLLGILPFE